MSYDILLKFAPVFTRERFDNPDWRGDRLLYDRVEFMPHVGNAKLLIDHDDNREIGTVHALSRIEWMDGPWHLAHATLLDEPPPFLKKGCPVSFGRNDLHRRTDFRVRDTVADRVYHSWVFEVSVLSPGVRPVEPLAEVCLLQRSSDSPPVKDAPPGAAGENHLSGADWALRGRPGTLRRRNIGRVVGVR